MCVAGRGARGKSLVYIIECESLSRVVPVLQRASECRATTRETVVPRGRGARPPAPTVPRTRTRSTRTRRHAHTRAHRFTQQRAELYRARAPRMLHATSASPARRAGSRVPPGLAAAGARRAAALELVLFEGHVGEGELLIVGSARGARRGEGRTFREEDALPACGEAAGSATLAGPPIEALRGSVVTAARPECVPQPRAWAISQGAKLWHSRHDTPGCRSSLPRLCSMRRSTLTPRASIMPHAAVSSERSDTSIARTPPLSSRCHSSHVASCTGSPRCLAT